MTQMPSIAPLTEIWLKIQTIFILLADKHQKPSRRFVRCERFFTFALFFVIKQHISLSPSSRLSKFRVSDMPFPAMSTFIRFKNCAVFEFHRITGFLCSFFVSIRLFVGTGNFFIYVFHKNKRTDNNSMDVRQKQLLFMNLPFYCHVVRCWFLPTSSQPLCCFAYSLKFR